MEHLPEELLVNIFSYLGTHDLANLKIGSKHFYSVIHTNSKRMPKKRTISLSVTAKFDIDGKPTVEVMCGDGEHKILLTDTQIIAKEPYYFEWGESKEKTLQIKHYKRQYEKHLTFLESFSRVNCDGRPFDSENPFPCTSIHNAFQETLLFFLRRSNLDLFGIEEGERKFTSTEMGIILAVMKSTGPSVCWMRRMTETIDEQYLEIINESKCDYLMFCGYFDHPMEKENGEYSVNNRILLVRCEELVFYEPTILSVSTMLHLIKEWQSGSREIEKYTYHHEQEGLDWFPLVEEDFNIIKTPEDIIWTCNATIHLKTFTVAREVDKKELQFYYYGTYLELQCYPKYVPLPATKRENGNRDEEFDYKRGPTNWDEEMEDLDLGLFD